MSFLSFYLKVVQALEMINVPYMILGSFASLVFGISRTISDIDIMGDFCDAEFDALTIHFPRPRYFQIVRTTRRLSTIFTLIDTELRIKADLVPLACDPYYRTFFERRVRLSYQDDAGLDFNAWYVQPTDVFIGKLKAWHDKHSVRDPGDIYVMLVFTLSYLSNIDLDLQATSVAATQLGPEVAELWQLLCARAEAELESHRRSQSA